MTADPIGMLLVEDNEADARLLKEGLADARDPRFEITLARRLRDGLSLLSAQRYDLVLLDLGLPDSHGLDTLRATRKAAAQVPIMVLTGFDDGVLAVESLLNGAQAYLVKQHVYDDSFARSMVQVAYREPNERSSTQDHADGTAGTTPAPLATPPSRSPSPESSRQVQDEASIPYGTAQHLQTSLRDTRTMYSGRVQLRIQARSGVSQAMAFLDHLRANPYLRILMQMGTPENVTVLLDVIRPLDLRDLLYGMDGVSSVKHLGEPASSEGEVALGVVLGAEPSIAGPRRS